MVISVAQAQLFFLAFTRIMATIIHVPVMGGQMIPPQVKIGLGLILSLFLIPWQPVPAEIASIGFFGFAIAIGKEILIGTLAGYSANLVFGAIQMASEVMGLGSGFSSSRIFNPTMGQASSAYDQLFVMGAMMYFLAIDGHHVVIIALQRMFTVIPINGVLPFSNPETMLRMTSDLIQTGIHLALPVMGALLLADLTMGLLARVAPQIQVYFLGLPVKVGISLAAMGIIFALVLPVIGNMYKDMGSRMLLLLEK